MHDNQEFHSKSNHDSNLEGKKTIRPFWSEMKVEAGLHTRRLWKWIGFKNKTLWDWLQLILAGALPVVVAYYGQQIQIQAQMIANDEKHQEILSTYLEDITKLLLEEKLRQSEASNDEVQVVARIKTLNTVRRLDRDGESKGQLLKFLYEADLIGKCQIKDNIKCGNRQIAILHLNDARLDQASVPSTGIFSGIDLNAARLSQATLTGIDLTNAQLRTANLEGANLDGAILSDANLATAALSNAHLLGTKMHRSILEHAILENADLSNAILENAKLNNAVLKGAKLDQANLQNADLTGADLTDASLEATSLQGANLSDAKLDGTSLQNTDLKGAQYNNTTQFPQGFNPRERGMSSIS